MHTIDELLHPADAAAFLGVSKETLTAWRREGGGPMLTRIGERIFYQLAHLNTFQAAQEK